MDNESRARRYRFRAEELRTAAESMLHPDPKAALETLAQEYDTWAEKLEALVNIISPD